MRLGFFTLEALRALRRNAAPSLAAAATVLVTALVLGIFIPVVHGTNAKTTQIRNRIKVEAELTDKINKAQVAHLTRQIKALPQVKSVGFRTKTQNLADLKRRLNDKELTAVLSKNPLPPSVIIKLKDPAKVDAVIAQISPPKKGSKSKPFSPYIIRVLKRSADSSKILQVTSTIKLLLGVLMAVLALASLLLVGNTIRLSIFARRRELEVMQLVGATNWFVRWPFVVEGLIVGAIGSFSAILLLWLAKVTIIDPLSKSFALFAVHNSVSFALVAVILLASGTLVSALGSGLTLRRFLRI